MWPTLHSRLGSVVTARSKEASWDSIRPKAFAHRSLGHRPRCQIYIRVIWPKAIFTLNLVRRAARNRNHAAIPDELSVSPKDRDEAEKYVRDQEEHHRTRSFQDEYRAILQTYEIEFDEQYVWD